MFICKYCKVEFDSSDKPKGWMANHSRWCLDNPKRAQYSINTTKMRAGITAESVEKRSKSISQAHLNGKYIGSGKKSIDTRRKNGTLCHSEETKNVLREKALASKHRRLKRGIIEYNGVLLDSKWEYALAKRLDELKIKWIRPTPIPWKDNDGVTHNYFPDFYLEDFDLFLDPKNPYAIKVQKNKLDILLKQYTNIVILTSLEQCENFSL